MIMQVLNYSTLIRCGNCERFFFHTIGVYLHPDFSTHTLEHCARTPMNMGMRYIVFL